MAVAKSVVAGFLIGALFGASCTLAYQGKAYDNQYLQLQKVTNENSDLQQQVEQLNKRLNSPTNVPVVESIRVNADAPDGLSEIEVIQVVKQELAFLIGEPLVTLQRRPELISHLIDGKTITVDQQQLTIHVNTVVVVSQLYVSVSATPGKSG
ncbi:hypothetical protein [Alicyclobacillus ferrooxydans]|uniref:Sporulation membrane protein YtrI C-terminal domain-containing protein n=1 Tax=Alicyclobacillus ferrooxydans TaxID=471514 RepID=A0A0P9CVB8_9BACL|nr:hypothetical protein [Alicyclobacillus ferrooxydans]KPV43617.1 hypothetical protein AN477_11475 [Alicyclobacillus ferrooxydans]